MSSAAPTTEVAIDIEADLLDQRELACVKTSAENLLKRISNCESVEGGWDICDAIWPAYKLKTEETKPRLILLPLSRLGAAQGYSGSHVMIGYFIDSGHKLFPSRPMIVKVLEHLGHAFIDKLKEEKENAESVKVLIAYHKDSFAVPLHFDSLSTHSLLWSPFSSNRWILDAYKQSQGLRLALAIDDLLGHLRKEGDESIVRNIVETVFHLLMPLHLSAGTAKYEARQVVKEYEPYLRNIDNAWANEWRETVWAKETEKITTDFGREWVNPFWLLKRLRELPATRLYCGAIHGDLHPRNVVLSDNNSAHVIDFGWTSTDVHIAKDFVLLECNLRFVALNPNISFQNMERMAAWIGLADDWPELGVEYCDERVGLIRQLRDIARQTFPADTNWNEEYVIPLFLVSLGLLKHLRDHDNHVAARLTVLSLATYIEEHILKN